MSRIDFAAKILAEMKPASVLDVGCRDTELADHLPSGTVYAGADLFPDERGRVKYVGDITTMNVPERYDAVVALDILEHLETPSKTFDRLAEIANEALLVPLPNCYDLKSRVRFFRGGPLGGKYLFSEDEPLDRHRWLMNRDEILRFYNAKARKHGMTLKVVDMRYGASGNRTAAGIAGRVASALLPAGLASATVYGVFEKRPEQRIESS